MKLKVAVLFGGKSVEHEISVISALQAVAALNRSAYDILPIYITKDNEFYLGPDTGKIEAYKDIPSLLRRSQQVIPARVGGKAVLLRWPAKAFGKPIVAQLDCALPIVHGTNTEDGTIQGFLRLLGIPFAGCDVTASAMGMDKFAQKCLFREAGIPVLDGLCLRAREYDADPEAAIARLAERVGYPLIVKPVNLGSSVGISKAEDAVSLGKALELAFQFASRVLVEPAVQHLREINCAVLGNADEARASVCEEPLNADDILSYENKYLTGGKAGKGGKHSRPGSKGMASLERKIPAEISPEQAERITSLAIKAFQALDCNGTARIDFLMDGNSGEIWLNEINTIPGSLSFYLWEPAGLPYANLLEELLRLGYGRQREQEDLNFSFATNVLATATFGGAKT